MSLQRLLGFFSNLFVITLIDESHTVASLAGLCFVGVEWPAGVIVDDQPVAVVEGLAPGKQ